MALQGRSSTWDRGTADLCYRQGQVARNHSSGLGRWRTSALKFAAGPSKNEKGRQAIGVGHPGSSALLCIFRSYCYISRSLLSSQGSGAGRERMCCPGTCARSSGVPATATAQAATGHNVLLYNLFGVRRSVPNTQASRASVPDLFQTRQSNLPSTRLTSVAALHMGARSLQR